jgi:hypothetical protein
MTMVFYLKKTTINYNYKLNLPLEKMNLIKIKTIIKLICHEKRPNFSMINNINDRLDKTYLSLMPF